MTDWIKKAAERVKARTQHAQEAHKQHALNTRTIGIEAPRKWNELCKALESAIDEFNSYLPPPRSTTMSAVAFLIMGGNEVEIRTQYAQPGKDCCVIKVRFLPEKEEIECTSEQIGLIPEHLYFRAGDGGEVYLVAADQKDPLSISQAVELILGSFFDQVKAS